MLLSPLPRCIIAELGIAELGIVENQLTDVIFFLKKVSALTKIFSLLFYGPETKWFAFIYR